MGKNIAIAYTMKKKSKSRTGAEHDAIGRARASEKAARETGASTKTGPLSTDEDDDRVAKGAKKMASGGTVASGDKEMNLSKGGDVDDPRGPTGPTGYRNRNKNSDLGGGQKRGPEGYPRYQESAQNEKGVHTPVSGVTQFPGGKGTSRAGGYTKETYHGKPLFSGKDHPAKDEHKRVLGEMKSMKGPHGNYAQGGDVACPSCGYSQGGMVANEQGPGADPLPNEFDDLALRDGLEFKETGANSGDELGGPSKDDLVGRAMLRRKKR